MPVVGSIVGEIAAPVSSGIDSSAGGVSEYYRFDGVGGYARFSMVGGPRRLSNGRFRFPFRWKKQESSRF